MFSKSCEYAIRAMFYIQSQNHCGKSKLQVIAKSIHSPVAFTAKILQQLSNACLLVSTLGPKGGFQIRPKNKITLLEIVEAIDGTGFMNNCIIGLKNCSSSKPCPMHEKYKHIKIEIMEFLSNTTIEEYAEKINNNTMHLI
jgi:Rrf2 family protein